MVIILRILDYAYYPAGFTGHVVLDEQSERLPAFYSYVYNTIHKLPLTTTFIDSVINDEWTPGSSAFSYAVVCQ